MLQSQAGGSGRCAQVATPPVQTTGVAGVGALLKRLVVQKVYTEVLLASRHSPARHTSYLLCGKPGASGRPCTFCAMVRTLRCPSLIVVPNQLLAQELAVSGLTAANSMGTSETANTVPSWALNICQLKNAQHIFMEGRRCMVL